MIEPEFLYIVEADYLITDFYRFGNSTSPRLDHVRPFKDVLVVPVNGIQTIVANGNGVSLSSKFDPSRMNTWKLSRNTPLPQGLKLVEDRRPNAQNHYMLAPAQNMPFTKYLGLLQELAMHCQKVS